MSQQEDQRMISELRGQVLELTAKNTQLKEDLRVVQQKFEETHQEKDGAYEERNHLVALVAHLFPSGIRPTQIEGWNPEWNNCVYIDLPDDHQISYHYHVSQQDLFKDLPSYTKEWDGHTKDDVHARLKQAWNKPPEV